MATVVSVPFAWPPFGVKCLVVSILAARWRQTTNPATIYLVVIYLVGLFDRFLFSPFHFDSFFSISRFLSILFKLIYLWFNYALLFLYETF